MAKLTLNDIASGFQSNTAANTNNTLIETALENTLSRDGTSPNQMGANIDMNTYSVINLGAPANATAAARLQDISDSDATGAASAALRAELLLASNTTGGEIVGFKQSGVGAVTTRTVQDKLRETISVEDFGAVGDGITDDTVAIQAAITALNSAGGGTLIFSSTYYLGTNTAGTITKFNITSSNVTIVFRKGAKFTVTSDNHLVHIFVLSGVSNITFEGELFVECAETTVYTTTGTKGARALSIENASGGDCGNIHIEAIRLIRGAAALVIGSVYTSDNRVEGIFIDNIYTKDVSYGINCANNGDMLRCTNLTTDTAYRSWFSYGCKDQEGVVTSYNHYTGGTVVNVSRYSTAEGGSNTNTEGFNLKIRVIDPGTSVTCSTIRHLGDGGATQKIQGISFDISANVLNTNLTGVSILNYDSSGGAITATPFDAIITNIKIHINIPDTINVVYIASCSWTTHPVITFMGALGPSSGDIAVLLPVMDVRVSAGNSFYGYSVTNLKFPATQVSSSDVNTLDDYEEGTWTPGLTAGTSGTITLTTPTNSMAYTKIGNLVTVTGQIVVSSVSAPVGDLRITGLPFTSNNSNKGNSVLAIFGTGLLVVPAYTSLQGLISQGTTSPSIRGLNSGSQVSTMAANVQAGTVFVISGSYIV